MFYLIFVSLIWGFSFVIIKGSLTSLDSSFVSFARLFLALILFIPLVRLSGIRYRDKLSLVLIGSMQFGVMYLAYIASFKYLPAHTIALLTTTTPIFVSVFSGVYARRLHSMLFVTAFLAAAGGAVLEFPHQPLLVNLQGVALIQASNAAFAFGQIAYKRWMASRQVLKDRGVFGLLYLGAVAMTVVFSLFTTDFGKLSIRPNQWFALLYLGVIASGLGFFLWNSGARKVNEGILAIMNNMKIPVAVIASVVFLDEKVNWPRLLAGCALIAVALYINERGPLGNPKQQIVH
jgi:drug/metabolite transporter (DMT)-like permease